MGLVGQWAAAFSALAQCRFPWQRARRFPVLSSMSLLNGRSFRPFRTMPAKAFHGLDVSCEAACLGKMMPPLVQAATCFDLGPFQNQLIFM